VSVSSSQRVTSDSTRAAHTFALTLVGVNAGLEKGTRQIAAISSSELEGVELGVACID
jgi:hypothetical protein